MKRAVLYGGLAALALVVLYVVLSAPATNTETATNSPGATNGPLATTDSGARDGAAEASSAGADHPSPPPEARPAIVDRLADGDSFDITWLDTGDSDEIRLFGINAPEANACFGSEAGEVLDDLTRDQELMVESLERDDFGRVLANVWVADVFVNLRVVEQGAALALTDSSRHEQLIRDAQSVAQRNQVGLWDAGFCGPTEQTQLIIAEIFANAPGPDNENPNGEWIDITNAGQAGADLSGWSIRDESTRHRFFFPDGFSLDPTSTVRVFSGCGDDNASALYWCDGDPVWNNGGDTGFLVNPDGAFVDTLSYSG